jgi:TRAP-type C4-dicarboxylate transport system substrate-binding protein
MTIHKTLSSLSAGCALMAFAGAAQAETVLTFNWWIPPTHLQRTEVMNPWAEAVAEATNGEVASNSPPPRLPRRRASRNWSPMAWSIWCSACTATRPDRFVNAGVMELPFMATTGEHASIAYWRAYEKYFAATGEHEGVRVLAHFVHSPGTVMARERVLGSIDDFSGLLVRAGGGTQDRVVDALGASVVSSPAPTTYELLANGVVDATLMTPDGYTSFNLADHVQTQLLIPGGLFNSSFFVLMNEDAYARIPEEHREAFDALTGEYLSALGGRGFDTVSDAALQQMIDDGRTVNTADEALMAAIQERVAFLEAEWIALAAAERGLDGREVIDFLRAQMADLAEE